ALLCFPPGTPGLGDLAPHLSLLAPWVSTPVEQLDADVRRWLEQDAAEHGYPGVSLEEHGSLVSGPRTDLMQRIEFQRLTAVGWALTRKGYLREHGDVVVVMIRRGADARFIVRGGVHRTIAMGAL